MFKTETHMHTSEGSVCGKMTAEEMVYAYREAGYKTLFISNHFGTQFFDRWGELSWDETIERFMLGYRNAKAIGDRLGINVILSAEIEFDRPCGLHYLVYGVDEDFFKEYPDLHKMPLEDFSEICKQRGILFIQAHPYRDMNRRVTPQLVDGFEVCNPNLRHASNDDLAEQTAKEYSLYRTAGSDAHRPEDVGMTAMMSEKEIKTAEDYIELVKSGKAIFFVKETMK